MFFEITSDSLALIFAALTCFSLLLYCILDGYDLGIGISLPMNNIEHRNTAFAAIGPFWDANETWLVLSIGLLLVAFPAAHSEILYKLYLPATGLIIGLILRGVAFDFRAKVNHIHQIHWDWTFKLASILSTFSQGFMLGIYVMGLKYTFVSVIFALFSGLCVTAAYALIGNCFLIMKTGSDLQKQAIRKAKFFGFCTLFGVTSVSLVNLAINPVALDNWVNSSWSIIFAIIPLMCFGMFILGYFVLKHLPAKDDVGNWLPFVITTIIFVSSFFGLALSFYPYVIPSTMTLYEAASSPESLKIILVGTMIIVPIIFIYTAFTYYAFRGKADELHYY